MMAVDTARMRNWVSEEYDRELFRTTHYDGCEYQHIACAVIKLCEEVERLRGVIEQISEYPLVDKVGLAQTAEEVDYEQAYYEVQLIADNAIYGDET